MSDVWQEGQRVNVFFDDGATVRIEAGVIRRVRDTGPLDHRPERCIQVHFDNEMVMGGTGVGWVAPDQLTTAADIDEVDDDPEG